MANKDIHLKSINAIKHPNKVADHIVTNPDEVAKFLDDEYTFETSHSLQDSLAFLLAGFSGVFSESGKGFAPLAVVSFVYLLKTYLIDSNAINVEGDPAFLAVLMFALVISFLGSIKLNHSLHQKEQARNEKVKHRLRRLQDTLNEHDEDPALGVVRSDQLESKLEQSQFGQAAEAGSRLTQQSAVAAFMITFVVGTLNLAQGSESADYTTMTGFMLNSLIVYLFASVNYAYLRHRYKNQIVRHFMGQRPQIEVGEYKELAELDALPARLVDAPENDNQVSQDEVSDDESRDESKSEPTQLKNQDKK